VSWSIAQIFAVQPPVLVTGTDQVVIAKLAISSPPFFITGISLRFDPTTGQFTLRFPCADRHRRVLVHNRRTVEEMIEAARTAYSALEVHSASTPVAKASARNTSHHVNARTAATP
jgi:hypothetical protein